MKLFPQSFLTFSAAVVMVVLPAVALAAEVATTYPVNIGDGLASIVSLAFTLMGTAIGAVLTLLFGRDKSKIKLDDETRKFLELAIKGALLTAETKLKTKIKDIDDIHVRNQLVATALNLLLSNIPLVIDKVGLDTYALAELIDKNFNQTKAEVADVNGSPA